MDEYIVVKALENGVNIIGLTSGKDTKFHHTEKLDKGEVFLAQFTDVTTAIKINGAAEIYTKHGKLMSEIRFALSAGGLFYVDSNLCIAVNRNSKKAYRCTFDE